MKRNLKTLLCDFDFSRSKNKNTNKKHLYSKEDFEKFGLDALAQTSADPFKSLGFSPEDKAEDIKTRYRKLVKENHPDRLLSEGADEEAFNEANRRLAEINSAYRAIKETKGF